MEVGVNSRDTGRMSGVAMDFPVSDDGATSCSPLRVPPRLRRRLSETKVSSPSSVEEIVAKLRDADHRRQKFYDNLSSKARPKPRTLSQSSSHEEELGRRLEAKMQAAEQKRLSILAKAQMRLAKLDELRQAAKTGVEMRYKKESAELGSKVQSRVKQAEANRMLILKAYRQRRATLKERTSQSLKRRITRESKYKERVRAAICQKRAAAEKKRLGLLEADKKRARARVLQVRKIAKTVSQQREMERRRLSDKLEDRLLRAKRKRSEHLMQRARMHASIRANWNKQAELLSCKLARCWRKFLKQNRTTFNLTNAYDALNINEKSVRTMPFEQLALLIESASTLLTAKVFLDRLENRCMLSRAVSSTFNSCSSGDIDHLLKRVASPNRRPTPRRSVRGRESKKAGPDTEAAKNSVKLSRYQVRVVLSAYMILVHPDAVFSGQGEHEISLAKHAENFVREFEILIKIVLDGPICSSDEELDPVPARRWTFRSQLAAFDSAWCSYLNSFVVWKVKDAQSLEEDLVRAACQLELSMIRKCKLTSEGDTGALTHDLKAIQKQVADDQKLLREKILHLSGNAGIERMEFALSDTRMKYFQAQENGSPVGSPITNISLTCSPNSSDCSSVGRSNNRTYVAEGNNRGSHMVRSLFKEEASFQPNEVGSSARSSTSLDSQLSYSGEKLNNENELIVNEVIHEQGGIIVDSLNVTDKDENGFKAKVRETMEKAFWNGITKYVKQDNPKYDRVVELMKEVRDGICEMAPPSWKQEITEAIDLEILSQVLNSGNIDMDHLGKVLEFAFTTLQKLSAPADEDGVKAAHQICMKELAQISQAGDRSNQSNAIALIKGLRFILEQIQALKQEISKARIRIVEPLLKGPAGFEYLEKAFSKRYGPPSDSLAALPMTMQWLSSVSHRKDQEWTEHTNALSKLSRRQESSSQRHLPSTTLKTGGSLSVQVGRSQMTSYPAAASAKNLTGADNQHPECNGENVDLLVRLGLLKLVSEVSGLTPEVLPETLKLNFSRLRSVQAQFQKIIVIATSALVLRQVLVSEQIVGSTKDMETMILASVKGLSELLDTVDDAGIEQITETLGKFLEDCDKSGDTMKLQSRKDVVARMLTKSLQAGDAVFVLVSRAVYLAARGAILGGSRSSGRELAETALQQLGVSVLTDSVVEAAGVLVVAATVTCGVHGPWYALLVEKCEGKN